MIFKQDSNLKSTKSLGQPKSLGQVLGYDDCYDFSACPMTIAHGIERAGAHNGERMLSSLLF